MSEIIEGTKYDLYDFTKSIYIFAHMKTMLVDSTIQNTEEFILTFLLVFTWFIYIFVLLKIIIVMSYFILCQACFAIGRFFSLFIKSKCDVSWKLVCKFSSLFIFKLLKKCYTFNFYIIQNRTISIFLIFFFMINITLNFLFIKENISQIDKIEKEGDFIYLYFSSFESYLIMELIVYMFYSVRNIVHAVFYSFGYFIALNLIIAFVYLYADRYEYLYGAFMLNEPQRVLNIIIFSILMILKIYCLYKIINFNKESK